MIFLQFIRLYFTVGLFLEGFVLSFHKKSSRNILHAEIKAPLHVFIFQTIFSNSVCFVSTLSLSHQRQAKYSENKLKSIKARNEYLLTLEATNASIFKYYIHDLSDLIDVSTGGEGGKEVQGFFHR